MAKKTFIIAEIAQAHEGSLGIMHSYIDALATTGVDAIKFQTHIAAAESSDQEQFRVNFSYVDKTRYDYWKRMEFTPEQWAGIKNHCEEKKLEFISSPFSLAAVDLLEKLNVTKYKIGSGEVTNHLLIDHIIHTKKEIILSSGMSDLNELDATVVRIKEAKLPYSILQCTTAYPTQPSQWGLNIISLLKKRYEAPIGFSDHSGDIYACLAATSLGAEILEFHAVFHKEMFGPDTKASLTPDQIKQLTLGVRQIDESLNNPMTKVDVTAMSTLKIMFGKTLCINKNLNEGHTIKLEDLESKKPANQGIPASDYQQIIGKKINKNMKQWDFLHWDHLSK